MVYPTLVMVTTALCWSGVMLGSTASTSTDCSSPSPSPSPSEHLPFRSFLTKDRTLFRADLSFFNIRAYPRLSNEESNKITEQKNHALRTLTVYFFLIKNVFLGYWKMVRNSFPSQQHHLHHDHSQVYLQLLENVYRLQETSHRQLGHDGLEDEQEQMEGKE